MNVAPITMEELRESTQRLAAGALILDVRTPEEFAEGHVPGAKNIPVDEVEHRAQELQGVKHLYIYCRAGRRAVMAAQVLHHLGAEKLGIDEMSVVDEGGMPEWVAAKFPVER